MSEAIVLEMIERRKNGQPIYEGDQELIEKIRIFLTLLSESEGSGVWLNTDDYWEPGYEVKEYYIRRTLEFPLDLFGLVKVVEGTVSFEEITEPSYLGDGSRMAIDLQVISYEQFESLIEIKTTMKIVDKIIER